MPFTVPPIPPNSGDPANFNSRADAFLGWFPTFVADLNAAGYPDLPSRALLSGTAAAPVWTWDADPNTGLYRPGNDQIGFSAGGSLRMLISTTAITPSLPVLAIAGTAAAPGYSVTGDTNTGVYFPGADQVALTTGGVQRLLATTTTLTSALPFYVTSGTAANPAISPTGDANTGAFFPAADTIAWSTGGVERLRLTAAGLLTSTTAITQGNRDSTSGRLLTVGDFGLGGWGVSLTPEDNLDVITDTGFYRAVSSEALPSGLPPGVLNSAMIQNRIGAAVAWQLVAATTNAGGMNGRIFSRMAGVSGQGGQWRRLLDSNDLSGLVNDGAIFERGSNANGEYVKFADGTMICWPVPVSATCDTAIGPIFTPPASLALSFPAAFVSPPRCLGSYQRTGGSVSHWMGTISASNTTVSFRPLAATTGAIGDCHIMAFGRWK